MPAQFKNLRIKIVLQSMTGFARNQIKNIWGIGICELRSTNHRFLEIVMRLPDNLRGIEFSIRELIKQYLHRGKVECTLHYEMNETKTSHFKLNNTLIANLCKANEKIGKLLPYPITLNTMDILTFPGVVQNEDQDFRTIEANMQELVLKTLPLLIETRTREGAALKKIFLSRIDLMADELHTIRSHLKEIYSKAQARLLNRFKEASLTLDEERLHHEMVMFAHKMDVAEEIERFNAHLIEITRVLEVDTVVGRRLDFLMQELTREANTLGAKSLDANMSKACVELKVLIEIMREQIQNVE